MHATVPKYLEEVPLVLKWKTGNSYISKPEGTSEQKIWVPLLKIIAEHINLDDCIECIAKTPAFITRKDNKPEFWQNLSSRLINPAKVGKVSKQIIEKINKNWYQNLIWINGRKPEEHRLSFEMIYW